VSNATEGVPARVPLRDQLGAKPDPDFELRLLPGWTRWTPDGEHMQTMGKQVRERLAEVGRPDLAKDAHSLVLSTFKEMRQKSVIAVFSATEDRDDTIWMPGSMTATIRRPGGNYNLDELVVHLIREYGGKPLFGDKRFVRYKRQTHRELPDGMARLTTIEYMTPVPTSDRRRALCLTASYGVPMSMPADDDRLQAYELAFDSMVSTLRWVPPAGNGAATSQTRRAE